ncbi:restriction endonuclease subunit S [Agrobacterium tumefaciens]|uniref:Type I restriction modification DNA specificity domain-containing protein n=1 Tax=Agrobacterium tumefaciens TaxID=358 RepID=A0AA44JEW4_AGRTU|nr:restriction endonuclease subunit S [Agrobacterium tumefaciens]NSL20207.1 hypothetical protein [Agrobacterium tumefaciens]NTB88339.1 hypothetical protein [Agrobacterium tumefaciens]NTC16046.1 hypothetical protein [Agrobacterium tumefaciens]NTC32143.1 hypothetical protein [Agrobacterium tumefaciens]NTC54648.1 hypothetical protein [Agrobacterium tumefaciens]
MSGLPMGWVEATLVEVFTLVRGLTYSKEDVSHEPSDGLVVLLRANNIQQGQINLDDVIYLPLSIVKDDQILRAGDIVLATSSGSRTVVGKAARVTSVAEGTTFGAFCGVARPKFPDADKLLFQYMRSHAYREYVEAVAIGNNINNFRTSDIQRMAIPLPPLAEQKRIVAKLDVLNAKSARARTELARIETLVSRYKQVVLSKAFSGELIGLIPVATQKPHALCWDLPSGWRWVAFQDAVEIASNLVNPATIPDLPHIAPDNIEGGTTRLLPFNTIREDGVISAKHRFYAGQVLYSKIRPYLRKAVIVDFDGACSADMYPLSPRGLLSARYLLQWLVGEQFTHFAIEHQGRTVLPKINQNALNQLPLPLPPLAEQDEIVRRIESAFSKIDQLAIEARRALTLVSKLDEAILAKAFRGELVSQNENDEPAEKLLERIRTEQDLSLVKPKRNKRVTSMSTAREFLNTKLEHWPADGVNFQDLKREFGGSYDDLKEAVFASLSDEQSPLQQIFDDKTSTMAIRKRER